ncbi:MAG: hypothetical protein JWM56_618 [Candidatus Peribacteria bacterium]|nr:hypothetical protein [Candidatus Peribacteria bacterium]
MRSHPPLSRVVITLIVVCSYSVGNVPAAGAAVTGWEKGASMNPTSPEDFGSAAFRESLRQLVNAHANMVSLTIPYHQDTIHSVDIQRGWNTPSDRALIRAIDAAHELGLAVALNIHVESHDGFWRAEISPADRNAWFTNYAGILNAYAALGETHGVEQMTIGTELIGMSSAAVDSTNTQHWKDMIADVRSRFSGALTYSANHGGSGITNEKDAIGFWADLDSIGISAYHPLSQNNEASVETMKEEWDTWNKTEVQPLQQKYNKPILFTEVGYRSVTAAHKDPWEYSRGGCYDPAEQVRDYDALFSYWNTDPHMQGVVLWDWKTDPHAGGDGNTDFTPQSKPAQRLITHWFRSGTVYPAAAHDGTGSNAGAACLAFASAGNSSSFMGNSSSSSLSPAAFVPLVTGTGSSSSEGGGIQSSSGHASGGAASSSSSSAAGSNKSGSGVSTGGSGGGAGGGSESSASSSAAVSSGVLSSNTSVAPSGGNGNSTGGSGGSNGSGPGGPGASSPVSPGSGAGGSSSGGVAPPGYGGGLPSGSPGSGAASGAAGAPTTAGIAPPAFGGGSSPVIPHLPPAAGRGALPVRHDVPALRWILSLSTMAWFIHRFYQPF